MKKNLSMLCLFAALTLLTACGATYYTVTTNEGKSYTAVEEPKLNTQGKTYSFKDNNGHVVILNQSDVKEIKSLSQK
ncbi:MAG: YgdI/YgdR family lipoprotein [Desulfarculus sp.]|nr:YgdI/YgdR family lipoprotein [Pseudomonadota bacterium]MBV1718273.1 YgdI/YgdR family lipoprotein [Desulfarculus sp.]MBU4575997.1 YgdI/YgdR family lipoprotein [Pseudomonadota bacterium]MBU4597832.1 YgdI/YgdR family lipoprotein [Pseudomonadota bacterium]MBV1738045.1 YgdI/YgdR family lipoprotein [Desulfarculus sp.]